MPPLQTVQSVDLGAIYMLLFVQVFSVQSVRLSPLGNGEAYLSTRLPWQPPRGWAEHTWVCYRGITLASASGLSPLPL